MDLNAIESTKNEEIASCWNISHYVYLMYVLNIDIRSKDSFSRLSQMD